VPHAGRSVCLPNMSTERIGTRRGRRLLFGERFQCQRLNVGVMRFRNRVRDGDDFLATRARAPFARELLFDVQRSAAIGQENLIAMRDSPCAETSMGHHTGSLCPAGAGLASTLTCR